MQALTDEERRKLLDDLRSRRNWWVEEADMKLCDLAADEIQRLADEVLKLRAELELVRRDEERSIYD